MSNEDKNEIGDDGAHMLSSLSNLKTLNVCTEVFMKTLTKLGEMEYITCVGDSSISSRS
jgi:hypothetical protein